MDIASLGLLAYGVIAVVVLVDSIAPVVPSEGLVVAAAAGTSATDGGLAIVGVLIAAAVGAFAGDLMVHLLGCHAHGRWLGRIERTAGWNRAIGFVRRGSVGMVVVGRFVPLGRTATAFVTGTSGMAWRRYVPAAALGATLWATMITVLGRLGSGLTGNVLVTAAIGMAAATVLGGVSSVVLRRRSMVVARPRGEVQELSSRTALMPATMADDGEMSLPSAA